MKSKKLVLELRVPKVLAKIDPDSHFPNCKYFTATRTLGISRKKDDAFKCGCTDA